MISQKQSPLSTHVGRTEVSEAHMAKYDTNSFIGLKFNPNVDTSHGQTYFGAGSPQAWRYQ